jgi:metal-responsive CopG/Arc/MetJ family transcriptional regulator
MRMVVDVAVRSGLRPLAAAHYNALQMDSQLTIRLPSDLSEALARASRKSGRKSSDIVRAALRDYLSAPAVSGTRPAERVRGLIGSLNSGVADLAEQHRKYVLESLTRGQ